MSFSNISSGAFLWEQLWMYIWNLMELKYLRKLEVRLDLLKVKILRPYEAFYENYDHVFAYTIVLMIAFYLLKFYMPKIRVLGLWSKNEIVPFKKHDRVFHILFDITTYFINRDIWSLWSKNAIVVYKNMSEFFSFLIQKMMACI